MLRPSLLPQLRTSTWPKQLTKTYSTSLDKFKILFLGRDEFSCLVLQQLYQAPDIWKYLCVATNPDELATRRGARLIVSPLRLFAESLKLPIHLIPHTKQEFRAWKPPEPFYFAESEPPPADHLIVTASFGKIVPSKVLRLFQPGRKLNIHPSLLPAYRGPAPLQHTIANGDTQTGVCIIDMLKFADGIDSGPIWACKKMPVPNDATFLSLRPLLALEGGRLLVSVLRDMLRGEATSIPQAELENPPKAPLVMFQDSLLDFSSMDANRIERLHRGIGHQRPLTAYLPSGKSLQLHSLSIPSHYPSTLSHPPGTTRYHSPSQSLTIRCAQGSVLKVRKVKQEAKALLDAHDWWNGVKGMGMLSDGEIRLGSPGALLR